MDYNLVICIILSLYMLQNATAQIAIREIRVDNLLRMQQGIGWPHRLNVSVGHEALLTLSDTLDNMELCSVTTPLGVTFDVKTPPSDRFESWGDRCGVRIKNVMEQDEGRWRLTAAAGNDSLVGWSEVYVDEVPANHTAEDIALYDGAYADVLLTSLNNSYCVVAQPFSEGSLIPGQCKVTLEKATRAVQGNWNILLGVPGRVQEIEVDRRVIVEAERLDFGYIQDSNTNKLHLYCNILHSTKNITFCRFQKTSGSAGYNVVDGLSDGSHSYYGDGFLHRECGMTIENPTNQDYGTWRCSVGVQMWVNNVVVPQTPMQALISVDGTQITEQRINKLLPAPRDEAEVPTIFVQNDAQFSLMCRANVSLSYCWFQHPNGSQFTPVPIASEGQSFWYTGESLQTGDCGITFSHATSEDEGLWTCHMGPNNQLGLEVTDQLEVRVTGALAANRKIIATYIGGEITLHCHTSNGNRPLDYCRFLTPAFVGLRLDSRITKENAILNRFYFTPDKNIDFGDCSLTISAVEAQDIGVWTCAAFINDDIVESMDTITLYIEESYLPRSRAGIMGMAVGLLVLVVFLIGYLVYSKRNSIVYRRNRSPPSQTDGISMRTVSTNNRNSVGSNSSGSDIILDRPINSRPSNTQI